MAEADPVTELPNLVGTPVTLGVMGVGKLIPPDVPRSVPHDKVFCPVNLAESTNPVDAGDN